MIVGAIVELGRANYVVGIVCTVAGGTGPAGAIVLAIDRFVTRRRVSIRQTLLT